MKAIDLSNLNLFGKLVDRQLDEGCYYCRFTDAGNDVAVFRTTMYGKSTPKSDLIEVEDGRCQYVQCTPVHALRMFGRIKDGVRTYTMTDENGERVEFSANLINSLARAYAHKRGLIVPEPKPETNDKTFGILRGIALLPDRFETMQAARRTAAEMAGAMPGSYYTVIQLFETVRLVTPPPPPPTLVWSVEHE